MKASGCGGAPAAARTGETHSCCIQLYARVEEDPLLHAYERLAAHKHEGETFSDVVLRLAGDLANDGTPVADGDVIIGATATIVDEPVLTRTVADFERMDGVAIETY